MKQLPGLDASFLHLETPQMPMHVGALHNFELPADYRGDFVADMRHHMAARLVLAPALRQKLVKMPLNLSNPTWVDAEPDLDEHVVGITLPKGSGQAELEAQVGQLHPVLLDRSRPLWKFHVFNGLAPTAPDGTKRFAMYTQLHHAAVDGQAAVALGQAILDLSPAGREVDQQRKGKVRRELGLADMLRGVLGNQAGQVLDAVKAIPGTVGVLSQMATQKVGDTAGRHDGVGAGAAQRAGRHRAGKSVSNLGAGTAHAAQRDRVGHTRVRVDQPAARRAERDAPQTQGEPERRGADDLQRRAAAPLPQTRPAAAQVAGRRRAGVDCAPRATRSSNNQATMSRS